MKGILHKSRLYPIVLITIVFLVWKYRQSREPRLMEFSGVTMGSITYNIKYLDKNERNYKVQIDSLLQIFNLSLNHYLPNSEISEFNRDSIFYFKLPFFYVALVSAKKVYEKTGGAFDPTIAPIINAWGFGPTDTINPDSSTIDSLKNFVYFTNLDFDKEKVWKKKKELKLDFSASAKGYAVDVIMDFLSENGIENKFVEIGGELACKGLNEGKEPWKIGVIDPRTDLITRTTFAVLKIENKAMATSANNFNYIERDGKKWVHTISPFTGYPIEHNLLSATVVTDDCQTADAFATAFMVLGLDQTKQILSQNPNLDAFLIYSDKKGKLATFVTNNIRNQIIENPGK